MQNDEQGLLQSDEQEVNLYAELNFSNETISEQHQVRYNRRMNKKLKPHLRKLAINDHVMLKKDFDNNTKTRRETFGPFNEQGTFFISEIVSDLTVVIFNKMTKET